MAELNDLLDEARHEVEALSQRAREDRAEVADLARRVRESATETRAVALGSRERHQQMTDGFRRARVRLQEDAAKVLEAHDRAQSEAERVATTAEALVEHVREGVTRIEHAIDDVRQELESHIQSLRDDIEEQVEAAREARKQVDESARDLKEDTAAQAGRTIEEARTAVVEGKDDLLERVRGYKQRSIELTMAFIESFHEARAKLQAAVDEALGGLAAQSDQAGIEAHEALTGEALATLRQAHEDVAAALEDQNVTLQNGLQHATDVMLMISNMTKAAHDTQMRIIQNMKA